MQASHSHDRYFAAVGKVGYALRFTAALRRCYAAPLPPDLRPRGWRSRDTPAAAGSAALTTRQRAIPELVAKGQSNKEIAPALGILPQTVKSHLEHICSKLDVERRAQAIAHAKDLALLT